MSRSNNVKVSPINEQILSLWGFNCQTFRVKNAEMFQNKTARMSRWRNAKVRDNDGGNQLLCDLHKYFADVPREMCRNVPKQECKNVPTEKCKSKFLNFFFYFKILYLMVNICEMFRKSSAKRYPSKSARMYLCKNVQVSCNSTIDVWMPFEFILIWWFCKLCLDKSAEMFPRKSAKMFLERNAKVGQIINDK